MLRVSDRRLNQPKPLEEKHQRTFLRDKIAFSGISRHEGNGLGLVNQTGRYSLDRKTEFKVCGNRIGSMLVFCDCRVTGFHSICFTIALNVRPHCGLCFSGTLAGLYARRKDVNARQIKLENARDH